MKNITRRSFISRTGMIGLSSTAMPSLLLPQQKKNQSEVLRSLVVASGNGLRATERAMEMIRNGADALDAVIAGVNIVEDDPDDMTVGLGGLPNEEGIVELDSSVMHGPTHR